MCQVTLALHRMNFHAHTELLRPLIMTLEGINTYDTMQIDICNIIEWLLIVVENYSN
jgi:bisphosphoglycerate-dependent phosphoglycerate mutase